jgi:hypothetical protein
VALVLAGCTQKSFLVVSVVSDGPELGGVAQLVVTVRNEGQRDQLRYPKTRTAMLTLRPGDPVTLSVSFAPRHEGPVEVGVTPLDATGRVLGFGAGAAAIDRKTPAEVTVSVSAGAVPPDWALPDGDGPAGPDAAVVDASAQDAPAAADAGARDGAAPTDAAADTLPPDALTPDAAPPPPPPMMCTPTAPGTCGQGQTCFVDCRPEGAGGLCTAGGTRQPGEACSGNADCAPGSQCFEFACGPTPTRVCMRFCNDDAGCPAGGRCFTDVPCGANPTGFRICSQPCDPRGDATQGCAAGLRCFLFPGEVPDCDCLGPRRMGGDGTPCTDAADCAPGLTCVMMAAQRTCRPLCRLDAPDCAPGRTCNALVNPDFKTFGACEP